MNWRDYIVLANGMAAHPQEAMKRSAVSRAYYGAFNVCRRWLESSVTPIDDRVAHNQVWLTFRTADRATDDSRSNWRQVGSLGSSLRALRNRADYDDEVPGLGSQAREAVEAAERILELLPTLGLDT